MRGTYNEEIKGMQIDISDRFRQIPTFGRFTIRRFHNNVSEMKKLAARDFEDILQVRMPIPSTRTSVRLTPISLWPVFHPPFRRAPS